VGSIEEARFSVSALGWPAAFGVLLSVTPYGRCTPMVCASSAIKLASSVVATATNLDAQHMRRTQTFKFCTAGGPYANRAAGQGCDRPEQCFTSEDNDHEAALSAQKSGIPTSWGHRLFLLR
jgi:hypothetical protein